MEKKSLQVKYELFIGILALVASALAVVDIVHGLNAIMHYIDLFIYLFFIIEYIIRLFISKSKVVFIRSNVLDLIAILPFNSIFRIFRVFKLFRLVKLAKLTKLTRLTSYFARLLTKCKSFFDTNGFKYMLLLTISAIVVGSFGISYFEKMSLADGFWWSFVTTTTVGYGDLSPATVPGRILAVILMIFGIGLLGSLTSTITSYFINVSKSSYKDTVISDIKTKINNIDDMSDEDIDDMCKVLKSLRSK